MTTITIGYKEIHVEVPTFILHVDDPANRSNVSHLSIVDSIQAYLDSLWDRGALYADTAAMSFMIQGPSSAIPEDATIPGPVDNRPTILVNPDEDPNAYRRALAYGVVTGRANNPLIASIRDEGSLRAYLCTIHSFDVRNVPQAAFDLAIELGFAIIPSPHGLTTEAAWLRPGILTLNLTRVIELRQAGETDRVGYNDAAAMFWQFTNLGDNRGRYVGSIQEWRQDQFDDYVQRYSIRGSDGELSFNLISFATQLCAMLRALGEEIRSRETQSPQALFMTPPIAISTLDQIVAMYGVPVSPSDFVYVDSFPQIISDTPTVIVGAEVADPERLGIPRIVFNTEYREEPEINAEVRLTGNDFYSSSSFRFVQLYGFAPEPVRVRESGIDRQEARGRIRQDQRDRQSRMRAYRTPGWSRR